jgi:NTE family protein
VAGTSSALVLAGGLALGAYHGGAYAALAGRIEIQAVLGSSIGAINGAILASSPAEERVERLRGFWACIATESTPAQLVDPFGLAGKGKLRNLRNWTNVIGTHLTGATGLFRPRVPGTGGPTPSLYDTAEARATLARFIDFDRLNDGSVRFVAGATDVESGESVFFDTAAGDTITVEHLLASGGLLPSFEPLRIDGRLLADGGFSVNAPLEPLLSSKRPGPAPRLCVLIDLFSPDGPVPTSLEGAVERSENLKYGCQTLTRLQGLERERALEARLGGGEGTDLLYLSYRAPREEAGSEKTWDFSPATLRDRWAAGEADAAAALERIAALPAEPQPGLHVHRIRRT